MSFTALEPAATCDIYQVQPEHAMLTGKLHAQARWSDSVSVFPISLSPAFFVGQQVWGLKCLTDPKSFSNHDEIIQNTVNYCDIVLIQWRPCSPSVHHGVLPA